MQQFLFCNLMVHSDKEGKVFIIEFGLFIWIFAHLYYIQHLSGSVLFQYCMHAMIPVTKGKEAFDCIKPTLSIRSLCCVCHDIMLRTGKSMQLLRSLHAVCFLWTLEEIDLAQ